MCFSHGPLCIYLVNVMTISGSRKRRVLLIAVTSSKEMKNEYFLIIPRRELLVTHRYL